MQTGKENDQKREIEVRDIELSKTYVFGTEIDIIPPNSEEFVTKLYNSAQLACQKLSKIPINKIIQILDKVSKAWANRNYYLRKKALQELPIILGYSKEMVEAGLEVISNLCSKENIIKRINSEIFSTELFENWHSRTLNDFDIIAVPKGILVHISAGNVFVGAIDSLVSGIITKNVNILKMSNADPYFPVLFMKSIKEHDDEGVIFPYHALLLWEGGKHTIEKYLFKLPLTVVFWGGSQALLSIRSQIGETTSLIEFGPRFSLVVIEDRVLPTLLTNYNKLRLLAKDICMWNQQACSSPQCVYIVGEEQEIEETITQFIYKLAEQLEYISLELPIGKLSFDENVEIRKFRELALMSEVFQQGKLIAPNDFKYTIIYDKTSDFKSSCLNRTIIIKKVENIEALYKSLFLYKGYYQTVALEVSSKNQENFEKYLIDLGFTRITTLGGMSEGKIGAPHEGSYTLSSFIKLISKEYVTPHDKIRKILQTARKSKYYSQIFEKINDNDFEISNIPLLDKESFYANSPPKSFNTLTDKFSNAYVYASGGTTGEPKFTIYSNKEYKTATDLLSFIYEIAGITKEDIVANLFIAGHLWTSFNVAGRALENIGCVNLPIGGGSSFEEIIKYIDLFKVTAIVGLPSIIVRLAEVVKEKGINLQVKKILYGGEHMRESMKHFIKSVFNCEFIRSAGYACVDTGPIGYQCQYLKGSIHHVLENYQYVEIINLDTLQPISNSEVGEIVTTNLDRTLMPIIRYRTGDLGRWINTKQKCECGFTGQSFELLGRCDDMLVIGGTNLLPSDFSAGLALLPQIGQNFQIVARTKGNRDLLVLRLEANAPISTQDVISALSKGSYKIENALANQWLEIEIEWYKPGLLPKNLRTGKIKTIIDER